MICPKFSPINFTCFNNVYKCDLLETFPENHTTSQVLLFMCELGHQWNFCFFFCLSNGYKSVLSCAASLSVKRFSPTFLFQKLQCLSIVSSSGSHVLGLQPKASDTFLFAMVGRNFFFLKLITLGYVYLLRHKKKYYKNFSSFYQHLDTPHFD